MYQIIICDDDAKQLKELEILVQKASHDDVDIITYASGKDLIENLTNHPKSCIFLLDLKLKDMDGIDLGKQINIAKPRASIIFITAYLELVTNIYTVNHCFFVLKSEIKTRLEFALKKAIDQQSKNREIISIQQNGSKVIFHTEDIIYIERKLRVTYLILENGIKKTSLKFDSIIKQLPPYFQRCHNSYIVNFKKIQRFSRNEVMLKNNDCIPVSRAYSTKMKEKFEDYITELV